MKTTLFSIISFLLLTIGLTASPNSNQNWYSSPLYFPSVNDYCGGDHFYDTGGADGNYGNNENITTTICPNEVGDIVFATFNSFSLENGYDDMAIYDSDIADTTKLLGIFTGSDIPGPFYSTHTSGCLTFVFMSDNSVNYGGWDASIECKPLPTCWSPTGLTASAITTTSAILSWIDTVATSWDIEIGETGFSPTGVPTNSSVTNPYEWTEGTSFTTYDYYVRAICSADDSSDWFGPFTFTTTPDFCAGDHFFDTGGSDGNYNNNENITTTICPQEEGNIVMINFLSFNLENNYDSLTIYNSNTADNNQVIGYFSGSTIPENIFATNELGCLTFVFQSDGSFNYSGWEAEVLCIPAPTCWQPIHLSASDILGTSATLSWTDSVANSWDIEIDTAGFTPTGTPSFTGVTNPFSWTGGSGLTSYDYYVRANCGDDDYSFWAGPFTFTTPATCLPPSELTASDLTATSATLNWVDSLASLWDIEIGPMEFSPTGTPTHIGVTNHFEWTEGTPESGYDFYVRANCGEEDYSVWEGPYTFVTPPTCISPSDLSVSDITISSVVLNWVDSLASTWDIEIGSAGFTPIGTPTFADVPNHFEWTEGDENTNYAFYVRANCGEDDYSEWTGPFIFTTAANYCGEHFYDTGGSNGNYSNSEYNTTIICPTDTQDIVIVNFLSFSTEDTYDFLSIYNDATTIEDSLIGRFTGNHSPGTIFATNESGCLTFVFESDIVINSSGWDATVECIPLPTCWQPTGLFASEIFATAATLSWVDSIAGSWDIEIDTAGFTPTGTPTYTGVTNPFTFTDGTPLTTYEYYVRADCGDGDHSNWSGPYVFTTIPSCLPPSEITATDIGTTSATFAWIDTLAEAWDIIVGSPEFTPSDTASYENVNNPFTWTDGISFTTFEYYVRANCGEGDVSTWEGPFTFTTLPDYCGGDHFFDTGGPDSNYGNNEDVVTTICPVDSGDVISVNFLSFHVENAYDSLIIYNSDTVDEAHIIGHYTSSNSPGFAYATNETGCLTFLFHSDISVNYAGWEASVTCEPLPSCWQPLQLTATTAVGTPPLLSWSDSTATTWDIEIDTSGFIPTGTPTYTGVSNPFSFTDAYPFVTYDYYVRADCGEGDYSIWSGPFTFTTPPSCFAPTSLNATNITTSSATLSWESDAAAWDVAIGPLGFTPTDTTDYNDVTNPFEWTDAESGSYYSFYVRSHCDDNSTSVWEGPFTFGTIPDYCSGNHFYDNGGPNDNYLSNSNETTTLCPESIGDTVQVEFIALDLEFGYDSLFIYNGTEVNNSALLGSYSGDITPEDIITSTDESGCLTFFFHSDGSIAESGWDLAVECLQVNPCKMPTDLIVTQLSDTSAELSWTQIGNYLTSWEIEYGVGDFPLGTGTILSVDTNPFVLGNLIPGIDYSWYIRGVCGENEFTTWSDPVSFNSTIVGIHDWNNNLEFVNIYPNPTTGKTIIELNNTNDSELIVRMVNVLGKIVYQEVLPQGTNRKTLDFSQLTTGVYFIQLTDGKSYITQKLIIEK